MNANSQRELVAQCLIVLAVCVGGWLMLVKPKVDELARLEQVIAEHQQMTASGMNEQSIELAAARMRDLKGKLAHVHLCNAMADDTTRFYGVITNIAEQHHVHIQSMQPGQVRSAHDGKVQIARFTISLEGEYADVAEFLDAVCSVQAFIRPLVVEIIPMRGSERSRVESTFGCELLTFSTESLQKVGGLANAQP